ncbi:MAG: 2-oxoacid:acceptor oxidoreductase family protein [Oscillospiraceae bacterium]|nr:2-oxoacid:acceptor oxidoreductase family protein [Oscillospiraceae bacterium]MDD6146248.1 2-oxoacid:acceptor oxidoreductase family protein [Oscillospiraceae bacterium]
MSTTQILIAGFGGQGVLFAGKLLAYKGLLADKQVSWLPSYGPEMRGGTANCSVIISDEPVGSPIVSKPDCLVAMNLPSLRKYEHDVVPGGIILVDSTLVEEKVDRDDVTTYYVPATSLANEAGFSTLANMILMGKLMQVSDCITYDGIEDAVKKVVPAKKANLIDINIQAIKTGYDFE